MDIEKWLLVFNLFLINYIWFIIYCLPNWNAFEKRNKKVSDLGAADFGFLLIVYYWQGMCLEYYYLSNLKANQHKASHTCSAANMACRIALNLIIWSYSDFCSGCSSGFYSGCYSDSCSDSGYCSGSDCYSDSGWSSY